MGNAYLGLGATEGAKAIQSYERGRPERDARTAEAKSRQQLSAARLDEFNEGAGLRKSQKDLEAEQLKGELNQAQASNLKQTTFQAFKAFDGDGNVKHLNNFLADAKTNPLGRRMYNDSLRFDKLTRTPETEKMVRATGVTDLDGFFSDPDNSNFVLGTKTDGSQSITDMNRVYASTGYTSYMEDQQLERLSKQALIQQRMRSGMSRDRTTQLDRLTQVLLDEGKATDKAEAYQLAQDILKPNRGSTSKTERLAEELMAGDPDLDMVDAMKKAITIEKAGGTERERLSAATVNSPGDPITQKSTELYDESQRTTDQKKADEINVAKETLDSTFDGDFFAADMSDPLQRRKAAKHISRIEQEFPMTAEDRKTVKEIRDLTTLGDVAGREITDAEAGPIDSLIRDVKKYVSNDIKGTRGTAAYNAFRNTMLRALSGAAVSDGEAKRFNKAVGSLAEQKGPLLVKLGVQLGELKDKLSSIYDMNDEYVAKYRLNMDMDQLAAAMGAIDERIEMMEGAGIGATTIEPGNEPIPTAADFIKGRK